MEGAAAENMPDEACDVEMEEPEELTAEESAAPQEAIAKTWTDDEQDRVRSAGSSTC